MTSKRQKERKKKRIQVRFGLDGPNHLGFTSDISPEGFFIETKDVYNVGAHLHVMFATREGQPILIKGEVRWSKKAPPRYAHMMKSGMGFLVLEINQGEELFRALCL